MEYLRRKYTILPLEEAIERLRDGSLPPHSMVITFDDGYENNYTYAFPVLRAHSVPATIHLATDFVDRKTPLWMDRLEYVVGNAPSGKDIPQEEKIATNILLHEKLAASTTKKREERLRALEKDAGISLNNSGPDTQVYSPITWEECRMMRSWRITFGAHTKSHAPLPSLSALEQREEMKESRDVISQALGSTSGYFSYSHEQKEKLNTLPRETLQELGFKGALTRVGGVNTRRTDPFALKRITMDGTEDWTVFLLTMTGVLSMSMKVQKIFSKKP